MIFLVSQREYQIDFSWYQFSQIEILKQVHTGPVNRDKNNTGINAVNRQILDWNLALILAFPSVDFLNEFLVETLSIIL